MFEKTGRSKKTEQTGVIFRGGTVDFGDLSFLARRCRRERTACGNVWRSVCAGLAAKTGAKTAREELEPAEKSLSAHEGSAFLARTHERAAFQNAERSTTLSDSQRLDLKSLMS